MSFSTVCICIIDIKRHHSAAADGYYDKRGKELMSTMSNPPGAPPDLYPPPAPEFRRLELNASYNRGTPGNTAVSSVTDGRHIDYDRTLAGRYAEPAAKRLVHPGDLGQRLDLGRSMPDLQKYPIQRDVVVPREWGTQQRASAAYYDQDRGFIPPERMKTIGQSYQYERPSRNSEKPSYGR